MDDLDILEIDNDVQFGDAFDRCYALGREIEAARAKRQEMTNPASTSLKASVDPTPAVGSDKDDNVKCPTPPAAQAAPKTVKSKKQLHRPCRRRQSPAPKVATPWELSAIWEKPKPWERPPFKDLNNNILAEPPRRPSTGHTQQSFVGPPSETQDKSFNAFEPQLPPPPSLQSVLDAKPSSGQGMAVSQLPSLPEIFTIVPAFGEVYPVRNDIIDKHRKYKVWHPAGKVEMFFFRDRSIRHIRLRRDKLPKWM